MRSLMSSTFGVVQWCSTGSRLRIHAYSGAADYYFLGVLRRWYRSYSSSTFFNPLTSLVPLPGKSDLSTPFVCGFTRRYVLQRHPKNVDRVDPRLVLAALIRHHEYLHVPNEHPVPRQDQRARGGTRTWSEFTDWKRTKRSGTRRPSRTSSAESSSSCSTLAPSSTSSKLSDGLFVTSRSVRGACSALALRIAIERTFTAWLNCGGRRGFGRAGGLGGERVWAWDAYMHG